MEAAHCSQCMRVVEERLGYRSKSGEVLCGPCYFGVWSPSDGGRLSRLSERLRPGSRRPPKGRTVWIPGPTAELSVRRNFGSQFRRH